MTMAQWQALQGIEVGRRGRRIGGFAELVGAPAESAAEAIVEDERR